MKLTPVNSNSEAQIASVFESTLFQSPEKFIQAYNSGIVNRRNTEIAEFAQKVVEAYKNIELSGGELATISSEEISLKTLEDAVARWSVIIAVRSALRAYGDSDQAQFFIVDDPKKGHLYAVVPGEVDEAPSEGYDEEGELIESSRPLAEVVSLGKVAPSLAAASVALGQYGIEGESPEFDGAVLEVDHAQLLGIDTSGLDAAAEEVSFN